MQPKTEKNYKSGHFYKILLIDDDKNICTLVKKALHKNGYELVNTAHNAEDAAEKMGISLDSPEDGDEFIPYKLIITDVLLGGVNGFELCKKVKKLRPDIFVILVSGHDIFSMHKKITESEADDFIAKPFNLYELIVRVDMLLQKATDTPKKRKKKIIKTIPNKLPYINDVIGSYLIVDFIAYGKSTLIFKTINLQNDSFYALKILSPNSTNFEELVVRFEKEIEIMEMFNHPNIIKFYDRGYSNGLLYLVMEYLDGVDLEGLLIAKGRLYEKMFYSIAFDMACAVTEIHDKSVLHRDIKLKNLIYSLTSNQLKLCDFGISQYSDKNSMPLTQDGVVIGTPLYMAPEIFVGEPASVASDIYSFGSTLYHLATNSPPFVADNYRELLALKQECNLPPIECERQGFSLFWTELIIEQCLAPNPNDRPESMAEILSYLIDMKENISL